MTYVNTGAATNLDSGTAGLLKPTIAIGSQISTSGKTKIGDMSNGGGLAAAFDGTTSQAQASCANKTTSTGGFSNSVGVDWGSGNANTVARVKIFGPSDTSILGAGGATSFKLQGSTDNFSSSVVDLTASTAFPTGSGQSADVTSGIDASTAYRYHRVVFVGNATNTIAVAEVQFYGAGTTNNLTVKSAGLATAAAPSSMKMLALIKHVDSATAGTDYKFKVARDGTNLSGYATLNDRFTIGGGGVHVIESDAVDVTGIASGTTPLWQFETFNNKMVELQAIYLYWT